MPDVDWFTLSPMLAPALGALAILLADLLAGPRARPVLAPLACLAIAAGLLLLGGLQIDGRNPRTLCGPEYCGYQLDARGQALQAIILAAAFVCLLLAAAERHIDEQQRTELLVLMLIASSGALALAAVRDLAGLLVAVETATLPVVVLVALNRGTRGSEAAVKLLFTALGSFAILALGAALFYASSGTLYLGGPINPALGDFAAVRGVAVALMLAGLGFKLAAVPFHWWTAETFAGAPVAVSAFLATVAKAAGLAAILTVLFTGAPEQAVHWGPALAVLAAVTLTVGNLVALRQHSALRLLAWSTIGQAGWVVAALASGQSAPGAAAAATGYLAVLVLGSLSVFIVVAELAERHPLGLRHSISGYAGLLRTDRLAGWGLLGGLLTLAGLPPGILGLLAKVMVFATVIRAELWWLVGVLILNTVLGIAVYLRFIAAIFTANPGPDSVPLSEGSPALARRLALALVLGITLASTVFPETIFSIGR